MLMPLLSIFFYFLSFILSLISNAIHPLKRFALFSLIAGLILYALHILTIAIKIKGFPFADIYGFYSLLGNGMLTIFLLLSFKQTQIQNYLSFLALLGILSTLLVLPAELSPYKNPLYSLHITSALFSYSFSLLGAAFSIVKFFVESKLKHRSLEGFFLPLYLIRNGERISINLAFVFFTLTLIFGSLWSRSFFGTHWISDPKLVYVLFLWFYYAILVHLNLIKRIKPKNLSYGIVLGALFSLLGLLFVRHGF